ncbi:hypothetical protein D9611_007804 [Ephemerocybe angulata]|uniref:Uncharacterized protein n=1 Tax=Ephemerocybe angulata TaxID=980116 RepID=A0A8H5FL38_9AGAR|nr:hypothetical protein D9611_007804 [Tulosesus angulatus]
MVSWRILAGGYDAFIATYIFTATANSYTLDLWAKSATGQNPTWLAKHPSNHSLVYTVNELGNGQMQSYLINPVGSLSVALDTQATLGANPQYLTVLSNGKVMVVNTSTGSGRLVNTTDSGAKFNASAPVEYVQFPAETARDEVSNPTMVLEYSPTELWIPDRGKDIIWRVTEQPVGPNITDIFKLNITGNITQPEKSGPRQIAIVDDRLYVLQEKSNTLQIQTVPELSEDNSTVISRVPIIPTDGPRYGADWAAGALVIPPPSEKFPDRYIYVSNRNLGVPDERGDTIAIFELVNKGTKDEALKLVKQVYTGLNQIRGVSIGPPEDGGDEYLLASGQTGQAGVVVFQRVDGGRDLKPVVANQEIPNRTTFVWL